MAVLRSAISRLLAWRARSIEKQYQPHRDAIIKGRRW